MKKVQIRSRKMFFFFLRAKITYFRPPLKRHVPAAWLVSGVSVYQEYKTMTLCRHFLYSAHAAWLIS